MTQQDPQAEAKIARQTVVNKQRRVIFNDDTYELSRSDANTPEGFLKRRLEPLAGTHVDTIAFSVLGGWADAPVYDSKVQPIFGDAHGGPPSYWSAVTTNVKALIKTGRCPLQIVIDFAHGNGMELFASLRMNDCHDSFLSGWLSIWKKQHPELLVDTQGMLPEFELYTSAQDFSHEEVRQRKLEIIEEICQRYDVDGFELDYIRHPVLFSRRMQAQPCSQEEIDIITLLMHRIRQITDGAAERRGRPILIAARTPDSFARCLDNGMDLQAWLEQDLLDILIAGGGYAPFSLPVEELVEAARPHSVPVYPCVNQGTANRVSGGSFLEGVRGLASNWYRAGADGLYFWNLGTPFEYKTGDELLETRRCCYVCLDEVGDAKLLSDKDKLFCVDNGEGEVTAYYRHVSSHWPLPLTSKRSVLRRGVIGRVPLLVGDDVQACPPKRATLTIAFDEPAWKDILLFRLNGCELADGQFVPPSDSQSKCRLSYAVTAPPLKTGRNFIEVTAKYVEIPDNVVTISAIRLKVEYT